MTIDDMIRGLVRAAEFKEQSEHGAIWDDECRLALEEARRRGWGKNQTPAVIGASSDRTLDIVFDGLPGPQGGRFIEVEVNGRSVDVGEWVGLRDGLVALRLRAVDVIGGI